MLCSGTACSVHRMAQDGGDGGVWIGGEGRTASGVEIDDPDLYDYYDVSDEIASLASQLVVVPTHVPGCSCNCRVLCPLLLLAFSL